MNNDEMPRRTPAQLRETALIDFRDHLATARREVRNLDDLAATANRAVNLAIDSLAEVEGMRKHFLEPDPVPELVAVIRELLPLARYEGLEHVVQRAEAAIQAALSE